MMDSLIASKLICVGLEYGIKCLLNNPKSVSANLLLSIKRDRKRSEVENLIRKAIDMRDEYKRYLKLKRNKLSEVEGFMIPHVTGLDVAGIERGNLPAELQPYYKEAFERCLLSTIHAGETEHSGSVKDAIFMLNASRIGHGLSARENVELKELIADRGIGIELCPKSNQFTNGFTVFNVKKKGQNENILEYVYNDFRGRLLLSINTDSTVISSS